MSLIDSSCDWLKNHKDEIFTGIIVFVIITYFSIFVKLIDKFIYKKVNRKIFKVFSLGTVVIEITKCKIINREESTYYKFAVKKWKKDFVIDEINLKDIIGKLRFTGVDIEKDTILFSSAEGANIANNVPDCLNNQYYYNRSVPIDIFKKSYCFCFDDYSSIKYGLNLFDFFSEKLSRKDELRIKFIFKTDKDLWIKVPFEQLLSDDFNILNTRLAIELECQN